MKLKVGQKAPNFYLPSHLGDQVTLSDLRGRNVVLAFYPMAWTPIWTNQIPSYETEKETLAGLNAQVLGISVDHIPCLKSWADSLGGIHYPLLSDFWPHGFVSQMYDVFRAKDGYTERAIFVLDKHGAIRYIDVHDINDRPDNEEIFQVLRQIQSESSEKGLADALSAASTGVYLDDQEYESIPQAEVLLYCARWCKDCRKVRAWLDEHEIKYAEVDIDTNIHARNQVRKWGNGYLVTPVIKIGETIVLDYDVPKLEEAVRKYRGG